MKAADRGHLRQRQVAGWLLPLMLAVGVALAPPARATVSSTIIAVDPRAGVVSAREAATGRTFQFTVTDAALLRRLQPGQPVDGDFQALTVTIPGTPSRFRMVTVQSPATGAAPAGTPGQ